MRRLPATCAVVALAILLCMQSGARAAEVVADALLDLVVVQEPVVEPCDDGLAGQHPDPPELRPAGDDYDARLYRADLARAKRWGS